MIIENSDYNDDDSEVRKVNGCSCAGAEWHADLPETAYYTILFPVFLRSRQFV